MTNMKTLEIRDNNFVGQLPTELGLLSQLETFFFEENDFTGTVPLELCQLRDDWTSRTFSGSCYSPGTYGVSSGLSCTYEDCCPKC
jgi:hypothetical protein